MKWVLLVLGILVCLCAPRFTINWLWRLAGSITATALFGMPPDAFDVLKQALLAKIFFWSVPVTLSLIGWIGSMVAAMFFFPSKVPLYVGAIFSFLCLASLIAFIRDIRRPEVSAHVYRIAERLKKQI